MFNIPELIIDSTQHVTKQVIDKVVLDKTLQSALLSYVDAQTDLGHALTRTSINAISKFGQELIKPALEKNFNLFNVDWVKATLDSWTKQNSKNDI